MAFEGLPFGAHERNPERLRADPDALNSRLEGRCRGNPLVLDAAIFITGLVGRPATEFLSQE